MRPRCLSPFPSHLHLCLISVVRELRGRQAEEISPARSGGFHHVSTCCSNSHPGLPSVRPCLTLSTMLTPIHAPHSPKMAPTKWGGGRCQAGQILLEQTRKGRNACCDPGDGLLWEEHRMDLKLLWAIECQAPAWPLWREVGKTFEVGEIERTAGGKPEKPSAFQSLFPEVTKGESVREHPAFLRFVLRCRVRC